MDIFMIQLSDQVAFVTGGANGIGKGIVEALAQAGAKVVIADIDSEAGEQTAKAVNGEFYQLDVTDKSRVKAVVQEIVEKHGVLIS